MKKLKNLKLPIVVIVALLLSAMLFISYTNEKYFNVSFKLDIHTTYCTQSVSKGDLVTAPKTPTKDGYVFVGWHLDGESKIFDFSTPILDNLILYAKWDKISISYVVKFLDYDGAVFKSVTVKENEKVSKPENPQKQGYEFLFWCLNGKEYDFLSPITSDVTLTSKWKESEKRTYRITFDSNGGNYVAEQIIKDGERATVPTEPIKENFIFDGWYNGDKKFDFNSAVTQDINLVARWIERKTFYTVNFYSNGEVIYTYEIEKGNKVSAFIPNGEQDKEFVCWLNENAEYDFSLPVLKDLNLTAKWKDKEKQEFSVFFDSQNGEEIFSCKVEENDTVKRPSNPQKYGYIFVNWYLNDEVYDFSSPILESITLVAKWEKKQTPTEFVGKWSGVENFDGDEYFVVLTILDGQDHTLTCSDFLFVFVVDYQVKEIFVANGKLYVVIVSNKIENTIIFESVNGKLITDLGVLGGELILEKQ